MPSIKHRKYSKLVFGLDRLYSIELQSCLVLQKLWSLGSMSSPPSSHYKLVFCELLRGLEINIEILSLFQGEQFVR